MATTTATTPLQYLPLAQDALDVLPSYSSSIHTEVSPGNGNSPSEKQQDHEYHLASSGRRWLSLSFSSQAQEGDELPRFDQASLLSGTVRLDLAQDAVVRSVSVSVIGELTSPADYCRFLTITRQLFVSDANDLNPSLPDPPDVSEGKLKGEHTWPFNIQLPKGVSVILSDSARHNFRLPPTLFNQASKAQIKYKLVARVKKGILSSDNRLTAEFEYTPHLRPSQPSILRQIAYMENQPLIGPDGDPEGWKTLDPVTLRGKVFNTRSVEVNCVLSIARPLCFARGTTIPLMLSIACSDPQALDLLSSPSSPNVQLIRHASFSLHVSTSAMELVSPENSHSEVAGTATWWPAHEDAIDSSERRVLHGEVTISADATLSCRIVNFQIQYAVSLLGFNAAGFAAVDSESRTGSSQSHGLRSEVVVIVTTPVQGLHATSSLPPLYDAVSPQL